MRMRPKVKVEPPSRGLIIRYHTISIRKKAKPTRAAEASTKVRGGRGMPPASTGDAAGDAGAGSDVVSGGDTGCSGRPRATTRAMSATRTLSRHASQSVVWVPNTSKSRKVEAPAPATAPRVFRP